ncbi:unnamed protein product [Pleuronectes platessa]|uniref:Uncharacterized protein n=1 Tax=Pleuronectes platessa TaxID=8262 RepID=A0A9N7UCW7_PLEPL|nr:unnamed protein product [Pleuronectes platessa]
MGEEEGVLAHSQSSALPMPNPHPSRQLVPAATSRRDVAVKPELLPWLNIAQAVVCLEEVILGKALLAGSPDRDTELHSSRRCGHSASGRQANCPLSFSLSHSLTLHHV